MRIRRSVPTSSVSPSSCSSSSSCFSSSQHSTISSHSRTSSSNSTSSSSSPSLSLSSSSRRCEGLDLLVKAMFHVDGSSIGVPYIQRRIIRRRKPALHFTNLVITSDLKFDLHNHDNLDVVVDDEVLDCCGGQLIEDSDKMKMKMKTKNSNKKSKKRSKAVPVKYQDSVLQSWKPRDRRRRSSKV